MIGFVDDTYCRDMNDIPFGEYRRRTDTKNTESNPDLKLRLKVKSRLKIDFGIGTESEIEIEIGNSASKIAIRIRTFSLEYNSVSIPSSPSLQAHFMRDGQVIMR